MSSVKYKYFRLSFFLSLLVMNLCVGFDAELFAGHLRFKSVVGATDPYFLSSGDINQDGKIDLVSSVVGQGYEIFLQSGGALVSQGVVTGFDGYNPSVGDLNGDGKNDLLLARNNNTSGFVFLQLNGGVLDGGTEYRPILNGSPVTGFNHAADISDFDGDGLQDFLTVSAFFNTVFIFRQTSSGVFSLFDTFSHPGPEKAAFGDFNGDGRTDVAVATILASKNVTVYFQDTSGRIGGVADSHPVLLVNAYVEQIRAGDLNGDGKDDLVVAAPSETALLVFLQRNGTIDTTPIRLPVPGDTLELRDVAIGDLNSDGRNDLWAANSNTNVAFVYLQLPGDTFVLSQVFSFSLAPRSVSTGDYNGDGLTDAVVGNINSDQIFLYLQNHPPSILILQPDSQSIFSSGSAVLQWAVTDTDASDTHLVSLYFDTDKEGMDGTLIQSGLSANGSLIWNTEQVAAGDYYIYGIVDDGADSALAYSAGFVCVTPPGIPFPRPPQNLQVID